MTNLLLNYIFFLYPPYLQNFKKFLISCLLTSSQFQKFQHLTVPPSWSDPWTPKPINNLNRNRIDRPINAKGFSRVSISNTQKPWNFFFLTFLNFSVFLRKFQWLIVGNWTLELSIHSLETLVLAVPLHFTLSIQ